MTRPSLNDVMKIPKRVGSVWLELRMRSISAARALSAAGLATIGAGVDCLAGEAFASSAGRFDCPFSRRTETLVAAKTSRKSRPSLRFVIIRLTGEQTRGAAGAQQLACRRVRIGNRNLRNGSAAVNDALWIAKRNI